MEASQVARALAAAESIAAQLGLSVDDATVLQNSNKLALHLSPCDAFARVAHVGSGVAQFEIDLGQALARSNGCPVAALDPRVAPHVYEQDGFAITFWTYYDQQGMGKVSPSEFATALHSFHTAMRSVAVAASRFTDRVAKAQHLVSSPEATPALSQVDRGLLSHTLDSLQRSILGRGASEQLLHGEPHPGNVISTKGGPRFVDLETCCRGPVEFDLAHAPKEVSEHYPNSNPVLLNDCRGLVLAMVAAWRWYVDDEFPDGLREGQRILGLLREGPPWPTLDD